MTDACDRGLWIGLVVTLLVCGCLGGLAASSVSDGATDAESQSQLAPPSSDAPQQSLVIAHDDEATDPDDGEEPDDGHLETDYFTITYHEQYAEPAENIADIADDHYVVLHQKFGLELPEERIQIFVGPRANQPCDAVGCVDPLNRVWVTDDHPSLLHHELIHTIQLRQHWSPLNSLTAPSTGEGMFIEGTAKYLDSPPEIIAERARFDPDAIELTPYPSGATEYAERALFVEYILATYDREAFDALYIEGDVETLEAATGDSYETLRADFEAQLDDQATRLRNGGSTLPAFTYDVVEPEPGETITLDARTPARIEALDRSWYPEEPDEFRWDLTGDGEIDETGETATLELPDEAEIEDWHGEVTLEVDVEGETHVATQRIVVADETAVAIVDLDVLERQPIDEPLTATATVENDGYRTATETVSLVLDGEVIDSQTVELEPGASADVILEGDLVGFEPGSHEVAVVAEDSSVERTGTVTLEDGVADDAGEATADDESAITFEESDDPVPGFGVAAALAALAAVGVCLEWRRR